MITRSFTTNDNKLIYAEYKALLSASKPVLKAGDTKEIGKAFRILSDTLKNSCFDNGKPYILYPINVAKIVASEIGLRTSSVVCSLLFIPVAQKQLSVNEIMTDYGKTEAEILERITRYQSITVNEIEVQAENFRKLLLALAKDVRVILILLAIQLYKLRNISEFTEEDPVKFSLVTTYLYVPLAHRLGLYNHKTELEDLSMKYTHPQEYKSIIQKLEETQSQREIFIENFLVPVRYSLDKRGLRYEIRWRTKSVHSIWRKMVKQNIGFDEVYDIFAIRIIIDSSLENEKIDCWRVYSLVTDVYSPNPNRLRDWISIPKSSGYESLHTTVMGPEGKWVEIQIRTQRMDIIAELGLAAHWKYKGKNEQVDFDEQWLKNLKELLENADLNAVDFIDYFSLDLAHKEIFVFTPEGELKKLPKGATALDFAFEIHSDVGAKCVGAKVNHKVVPLRHQLQNGDQVEIITAKNQKPAQDWLSFVVTAKAKSKIKKLINEEKFKQAEAGKEIVHRKLNHWKLNIDESINRLLTHYKLKTSTELYFQVFEKKIDLPGIKSILTVSKISEKRKDTQLPKQTDAGKLIDNEPVAGDYIMLEQNIKNVKYTFAKCCSPIFGDDVFGFIRIGKGISIHRRNCPNALRMTKKFEYRLINIKWGNSPEQSSFQAVIRITGNDELGIVNNISNVISNELKMNMRSFAVGSKKGMFEGTIKVFVTGHNQLQLILRRLSEVKGVTKAIRLE
jgi:GTP pyrophosphokinase